MDSPAVKARFSGLFFVLLISAGCAVAPEKPAWPADLPPRAYYESVYAGDPGNREQQSLAKYLKWVKAFYSGWGGIRGWHSIRDEILLDVDVDAAGRESLRDDLRELGRKISGEWAKAYGQRLIDGNTVQVWIDAAYECSIRGDQERLLDSISRDVDALLAGRLQPAAITLTRYYPDAEQAPPFTGFAGDSEE